MTEEINRVHDRIDKVVDSIQRLVDHSHKEGNELRRHIGDLTTDVAILSEHLKNEVSARESIVRPCNDHKALKRTVDDHLESETKQAEAVASKKKLWESGKVRIVSNLIYWLVQMTIIGAVGYWAAKLSGKP